MTGYGGRRGDDIWERCPKCLTLYRTCEWCQRCAAVEDDEGEDEDLGIEYDPWDE